MNEPAQEQEAADLQAQPLVEPAPKTDNRYFRGTGRRKASVARVRIRRGSGQFLINNRTVEEHFTQQRDRRAVVNPLETIKMIGAWDVWANVTGGGYSGQAGAVTLGLARALTKAVPELETALRDKGLLTRDARMVERKKPGRPGARKRFQFSKR